MNERYWFQATALTPNSLFSFANNSRNEANRNRNNTSWFPRFIPFLHPQLLSKGRQINIHDRRSLTLMTKLDVCDVVCNVSQFLKMNDKFRNPPSISPMRPEEGRQPLKASLCPEKGYYLFGEDNSLTSLILLCLYYKDSR